MDKGQIILDELNDWIYNDENQAGDKLQIIDASDVPTIIENLVKKLIIPVFIGSNFRCPPSERCKNICEECALVNGIEYP
jgi:hypothetical protein